MSQSRQCSLLWPVLMLGPELCPSPSRPQLLLPRQVLPCTWSCKQWQLTCPLSLAGVQELRQRIRSTYEARWKAEKHFDEEEILQELPGALRTQVQLPIIIERMSSHTGPVSGIPR